MGPSLPMLVLPPTLRSTLRMTTSCPSLALSLLLPTQALAAAALPALHLRRKPLLPSLPMLVRPPTLKSTPKTTWPRPTPNPAQALAAAALPAPLAPHPRRKKQLPPNLLMPALLPKPKLAPMTLTGSLTTKSTSHRLTPTSMMSTTLQRLAPTQRVAPNPAVDLAPNLALAPEAKADPAVMLNLAPEAALAVKLDLALEVAPEADPAVKLAPALALEADPAQALAASPEVMLDVDAPLRSEMKMNTTLPRSTPTLKPRSNFMLT